MKYTIGIIDEEKDQIANIRRTIKFNKPKELCTDDLVFIEYSLDGDGARLPQKLRDHVLDDVLDGNIHALIIDYRIISESALVEGTDIYKLIVQAVPKFPVIILTNVPGDCYTKAFVDADKVYWKTKFFKLKEDYAREKTANIFRNMDNYKFQRAELVTRLSENLSKLHSDGYTAEDLQHVLNIESELGDFFPQQQTQIEKALSVSDLHDAVALLEEARNLLG